MSLKEIIEDILETINEALGYADSGESETESLSYEEEIDDWIKEEINTYNHYFDVIGDNLSFIQEKLEDLCDIRKW